jgi:hypothetical protein
MLFQEDSQETGWTGPGMMEPTFPPMPPSPMPEPAPSPFMDEPMRTPVAPQPKNQKAVRK